MERHELEDTDYTTTKTHEMNRFVQFHFQAVQSETFESPSDRPQQPAFFRPTPVTDAFSP
jgi:hypothetical protein